MIDLFTICQVVLFYIKKTNFETRISIKMINIIPQNLIVFKLKIGAKTCNEFEVNVNSFTIYDTLIDPYYQRNSDNIIKLNIREVLHNTHFLEHFIRSKIDILFSTILDKRLRRHLIILFYFLYYIKSSNILYKLTKVQIR